MTKGQTGDQRDPDRTCQGRGGACQSWPVRGSHLCRYHGGAAPAMRERAEMVVANQANTLVAAVLGGSTVEQAAAQVRLSYQQASALLRRPEVAAELARRREEILDAVRQKMVATYGTALDQVAEALATGTDLDVALSTLRTVGPQLPRQVEVKAAPAWSGMVVLEAVTE